MPINQAIAGRFFPGGVPFFADRAWITFSERYRHWFLIPWPNLE
jgi:hypothetical protein